MRDLRILETDFLLREKAIPKEGACTAFALATGLSLLLPEKTEKRISEINRMVFMEEFDYTSLSNNDRLVGKAIPIDPKNGGSKINYWIDMDYGVELMNYYNSKLDEFDAKVELDFYTKEERDPKKLKSEIDNGGILVLTAEIQPFNGGRVMPHHVVIGKHNGQYFMTDINLSDKEEIVELDEYLLSEVLSGSELQMGYTVKDTQLGFYNASVIVMRSKN